MIPQFFTYLLDSGWLLIATAAVAFAFVIGLWFRLVVNPVTAGALLFLLIALTFFLGVDSGAINL